MKRKLLNKCPICQGKKLRFYKKINDRAYGILPDEYFTLKECMKCHSVFVQNPPLSKDIGRYYSPELYYSYQEDASYGNSRLSKLQQWYMIVNYYLIEQYIKGWRGNIITNIFFGKHIKYFYGIFRSSFNNSHKLIDIGCGKGDILLCYKHAGYKVEGTELFDSAKKIYKKNKIKVYIGEITKLELPKDNYDIARMFHVIEHVYNPKAQLKAVYKILKPGGKLVIATPNIVSPIVRIFGENWFHMDTPRHLILFNKDSLYYLLNEVGFKDIHIKCYSVLSFVHVAFYFKKKFNVNINPLAKFRFILWPMEYMLTAFNRGDIMLVECYK